MTTAYQNPQPTNNNPRSSLLPFEICVAAMRGWRMFPVKVKGKLPLISEWPAKASSNPDVLEAWAIEYPGSNWGLATGKPSGVFVVDVDGEAGRASVADLERQGLVLPPTRTVTTGRDDGGAHLYFQLPESVDIHNDQKRANRAAHRRERDRGVCCPPSFGPRHRPNLSMRESFHPDCGPAGVDDRPADSPGASPPGSTERCTDGRHGRPYQTPRFARRHDAQARDEPGGH